MMIKEDEKTNLRKVTCGMQDSDKKIQLHSEMMIEEIIRRYYEKQSGIQIDFENAIMQCEALGLGYAYAREKNALFEKNLNGQELKMNSDNFSNSSERTILQTEDTALKCAYEEEKKSLFEERQMQFVKK